MNDIDPILLKLVTDVSQGNPGALSLLMRVLNGYNELVFPCFCYDLTQRGLLGWKIWELYKDIHKEDFDAFVKDVWTGAPIDQLKKDQMKDSLKESLK